ncbi:translation initiation factor IF-2 subunit gamma [Candidatus Woesearchaeota archaeon]|nr:translation initiation factor IF-2 subunit gamma [Candidatus Woesearchaeota archaeon]
MAVQPEVNIGLVGHVDHGKTTLTERFSGKWTDTHSEEMKRGITIRLGYADSSFYYCKKDKKYVVQEECDLCKGKADFVRKVSFVDAPGHESLMATMLSGATIMDGALLLVAANESCPQPQTREHLMALQISGIKNIIVIQNKIDLVPKERAMANYKQIKEFLKGTEFEDAPVIPSSAAHGVNVEVAIAAIQEKIPTPKRDEKASARMFVARSFDINKPGASIDAIQGGVLGGSLTQGRISVGDKIEIRPGRVVQEQNQVVAKPLFSAVTGAMTGGKKVDSVGPGGSVAVLTTLDPSIVKADSMGGNIVGKQGDLPPVWYEMSLETHLLERVVGSQDEVKVDPIKMNEVLMLNVNAAATVGFVQQISKNRIHCRLKLPVCAELGSRVTISRRVGTRFRLIGYGMILEKKG